MKSLLLIVATGLWFFVTAGNNLEFSSSAPAADVIYENDPYDTDDTNVEFEKTIVVGIINNPPSESSYREANDMDMKRVFCASNGYDAYFFYSLKNDEQIEGAYRYIEEGVDYLLISADDPAGWDEVLQEAKNSGIKVILFDRSLDVSPDLYEALVISDISKEGEKAVDWLLKQDLPEYNVVHLQGIMGSSGQVGRTEALDKQFATGRMNKVIQQTAEYDELKAKQIVESVIESGDRFNVIYAENNTMAKGAVEALDEYGISHGIGGDVIIMGFNNEKWALQEVYNGNWNFNMLCSPYQADCIDEIIKSLERGNRITSKEINPDEMIFDAKTITLNDVEEYGLGE